ncbi:glycoside hydrolase family 31 protein [Pelistega sp. NLN82]|uniref:Glycoside hydrolase family 31 protein n=1 Tax=Pelistega ratti TaxID=2652177 RepID=A0A6L9Y5B7_9BURK|nr:TIM-barrel domain-containing protein [Pelistega ratti]NEN75672.1 glycoside hydrolase family 31 protein [Pelistega ratti]
MAIQLKHLALSEQQAGFCVFTTEHDWVLRIEATALGVFRLRCGLAAKLDDSALNAKAQARRDLLLARQEQSSEFIVETLKPKQAWRLSQGNTAVEIHTNPFSLQFFKDEQLVLRTKDVLGFDSSKEQWTLQFARSENIYGLGRTTDRYARYGEIYSDGNSEYVPFAWSPQEWGIFVNSLLPVTHHLGDTADSDYTINIYDKALDIFIYIASPSDIFNQFSATVGRVVQPPLRAVGVWFAQADQQSLVDFTQQAQEMTKAGFAVDTLQLAPPSVFPFQEDKPSMDWDEKRLGDIRTFMTTYLKGHYHLCLPTSLGVPVGTALFTDLEDRAWLLLDETGKAAIFHTPYGDVGLLDLTYKDAYKLWSSRHQQLLDNTDATLSLTDTLDIEDGISARQGEEGGFLRALYPLWAEQALIEALSANKTPSEAYIRRHTLSLNSARVTGLYTTADVRHFEDLRALLRQHLTVQASAIVSQTHTIDLPRLDKQLYLRFLALSVFSAGFVIPAESVCLPMMFDKATQKIIKQFWLLRSRLIPYVLGIIEDANRTGLPVQRMMPLAFPQDKTAWEYEDQFLFGPALLVAPILDKGNTVNIYLPRGEAWWDLNTGIRYEGGQILAYQCEVDSIPVFGREGYMLCLGPELSSLAEFNSARVLDEVWLFGMPIHNPVVMRNKIRVMQMQGSSYIKGFEGLRILQSEGLEVKRRGAEVRISRER